MKLWVQFLVIFAVLLILTDQNGAEGKKNKQKHGRTQDRSPAKSGYKKENSRKTRDVSNEPGSKEKYNKKEEVKYSKGAKKNNNNEPKEKKNEFVDKKYSKQDKKQGKTEYVEKKSEKYSKGKKAVENEQVLSNEEVEEVPVTEEVEENVVEETEIMMNEEEEEQVPKESGACQNAAVGKSTEDKLVQCKKKTDSVETNMTETCKKYKSEKNMKVVERTVIGEKSQPPVVASVCDVCK